MNGLHTSTLRTRVINTGEEFDKEIKPARPRSPEDSTPHHSFKLTIITFFYGPRTQAVPQGEQLRKRTNWQNIDTTYVPPVHLEASLFS